MNLNVDQDLIAVAKQTHVQVHRISPYTGISQELASFQVSKQRGDSNFTVTDVQVTFFKLHPLKSTTFPSPLHPYPPFDVFFIDN